MIEKGKTYEVWDNKWRFWGSVCLKYPDSNPVFESNTISGYLDASSEFKEVKKIFLEHEQFLAEEGEVDCGENNYKEILSLGVQLVDPETGARQNVSPVFVTNESVFICDFHENRI